jgi:hypothetical protein
LGMTQSSVGVACSVTLPNSQLAHTGTYQWVEVASGAYTMACQVTP